MSDLSPTITKAVETGATKLLDHFKDQYGKDLVVLIYGKKEEIQNYV